MANASISDVELGFVEKTLSWKLRSKFFRSKVGGKPSWLSLENLPEEQDLLCRNCGKPYIFLLQIYAPVDDCDEAFHRVLFIFMCTESKCFKKSSNANFIVFRSQLPRKNSYYDFNPPVEVEEGSEVPSAEQYQMLCSVCGIKGSMKCEQCQKQSYCSQHHLKMDWENGHKIACNQEIVEKTKKKKKKKSCLLPEYELVTETEYVPDKPKEKSDAEKMKEYEQFMKSSKANSSLQNEQLDDLETLFKQPDKVFHKFQKRIAIEPEQVLRYQRGGLPLWVSSEHIPSENEVPDCSCGAKRTFEFQVLPQLLNYLQLDTVNDSIDWGTLIVYTCSKNCSIDSNYVKEFLWKQDFSDDIEKKK